MSYILDALKKSERERAIGNVPTLESAATEHGNKVPLSWLVGALLIVVIAFVLYESRSYWMAALESGVESETAKTAVPSGVYDPEPDPVPEPEADTAGRDGPLIEPQVESADPLPGQQTALAAESAPALPAMTDLDASVRGRMPPLSINVLSYSRNQSKRFVMINQNIYKEGQDMGGVLVEEIRKSDVVLNFEGIRFILLP